MRKDLALRPVDFTSSFLSCEKDLETIFECQSFTAKSVVDVSVVVGEATIDEGLLYAPLECVALQRTPAALAEYVLATECPFFGLQQHEVGFVAWTQVTSFLDAKKP